MKILIGLLIFTSALFGGGAAWAQGGLWGSDRDPAAVPGEKKRSYPGGSDEEDLRVQATLPEAPLKTDARTIQREVYRALYKEELKDDHSDAAEE